jgi:hypothetical protein
MSTQTGTYFIGTYGVPVVVNLHANLTGASAVNLRLSKPDGSIVTRDLTAAVITDMANGIVTYLPTQTDVNQPGVYTGELSVPIGGSKQVTSEFQLTIAPRLEPVSVLVMEDGTGLANANSYASLAEFDAYNNATLYSDTVNNATRANKERALIMATRVIDTMVEFEGSRASDTQALAFPRVYVPNRELEQPWMYPAQILQGMIAFGPGILYGAFWPSDIVPPPIKAATCELARYLMASDRTKDDPSKGISSLSLGSGAFSVTFNADDRKNILPDLVVAALAPFGTQRGTKEGFKRVVRT